MKCFVSIYGIKRKQGIEGHIYIFRKMSSGNVLGELYWRINIGIKDKLLGEQLTEMNLIRRKVKYTEMFVGRYIY